MFENHSEKLQADDGKGVAMAALELALILLATVLISAVLDQMLPRLPLPLIQIACGVVVAVVSEGSVDITLNPDLFLVLFIAPLLFNEAREADKTSLWRNRPSMLSFAIGLVVAIVLAVGFTVHAVVPSVPLAAAFALGAALGPTDPIAVASVSKRASISDRHKSVLQGESLLNDASGIVSFQFAIAAVTTGYFSALDAVGSFAYMFFVAIIVGVLLGVAFVKAASAMRDWGLENTTFHVALEFLAPFFAYLLGEFIEVSGVIVVVACGITMSTAPRDMGPALSRMNIVSSSVWKVVTFALNGVVFVMLGTQLPQAFGDLWIDSGIRNSDLIVYVLVISAIMVGMRFIWTLISETRVFHGLGKKPSMSERLRSAAVMTMSGSKGAITLAIMFSIPRYVTQGTGISAFPQRDLLIFLACGVILVSLLLATFVVPLLAPRKDDSPQAAERDSEAAADILRAVIEELTARQTPKNRKALGKIIVQYTERLERFKGKRDLEDESDLELRLQALSWEQEYVLDLIEADEVPPIEGYQYVSRLSRIVNMMKREERHRLAVLAWWRRVRIVARKVMNRVHRKLPGDSPAPTDSAQAIRSIQVKANEYVVARLKEIMPESDIQSEKISQLIGEYEHTLQLIKGPAPSITAMTRQVSPDLEMQRLALRIELEKIQDAYDEGLISRNAAQKMRKNVYLMQIDVEDYV